MAELLKQFQSIDFVNYVGVEDFSDKLNFLFSASLLVAFAGITGIKTYFLEPLSCYVPSPLSNGIESQVDYVNNYCWTEGTYAVSLSEFKIDTFSKDGGQSVYKKDKIVYYQWVPFVLAVQALFFYLPRVLWHIISFDRAGTDVGHIVKVAGDAARDDGEKHDRLVSHACRMIDQMLETHSKAQEESESDCSFKLKKRCSRIMAYLLPSRFIGNWLILTYLLIKLLYLANAIAQLVIMRQFLQLNTSLLMGVDLLIDILKGKDWQVTMTFPRVGCCLVYFRDSSRGNWNFAQCSLPINMINEKIFIFLWFWFTFIVTATVVSMGVWIFRLSSASVSNKFVKRMFRLADNCEELKKNDYAKSFSKNFLKRDGTFILKMIALNCGDIVCSEIIQGLWQNYRKSKGMPLPGADNFQNGVFKLETEGLAAKQLEKRRGSQLKKMMPWNSTKQQPQQLVEQPELEPEQKEPTAPEAQDSDREIVSDDDVFKHELECSPLTGKKSKL